MSWVGKLSWIFVFAEMEQTKAAQCQTCQSKDWRGTKGQSAPGLAKKTKNVVILGPVQTSHFCRVEFNANLLKQWFLLICIEFDATEMRRLNWALTLIMARAFATNIIVLFRAQNSLVLLAVLASSRPPSLPWQEQLHIEADKNSTSSKLFCRMNSNRHWAANCNKCRLLRTISNSQALSKMCKMCFLSKKSQNAGEDVISW